MAAWTTEYGRSQTLGRRELNLRTGYSCAWSAGLAIAEPRQSFNCATFFILLCLRR